MKKIILAIAAVTRWQALPPPQMRKTSTVTGAAIGAGTGLVVAGPPGAWLAALIGAVVGGPDLHYYHHHLFITTGDRHYYNDNGETPLLLISGRFGRLRFVFNFRSPALSGLSCRSAAFEGCRNRDVMMETPEQTARLARACR